MDEDDDEQSQICVVHVFFLEVKHMCENTCRLWDIGVC